VAERHGLAHPIDRHVVQQDPVDAGRERLADVVERLGLDLKAEPRMGLAQLAAGAFRVDGMEGGSVVVANRARDSALGVHARRIGGVALGEHEHPRSPLRCRQRGREPGGAGPDDE